MNNIEMNLGEIEWGGVGWNNVAEDMDQSNAPVKTVNGSI
jgi:hypothetical protein